MSAFEIEVLLFTRAIAPLLKTLSDGFVSDYYGTTYLGMMMKLAIICTVVVLTTTANAQSVTGRVTGAVGGATAGVSAGAGAAAAGGTDFSALNTAGPSGIGAGGDWNGGARARIGGKDVTLRGAVANEGSVGAFKAGAGIGF